jgi:hypothetical protein
MTEVKARIERERLSLPWWGWLIVVWFGFWIVIAAWGWLQDNGVAPSVPYISDLDCADVGHEVSVSGSDPHGLDADHDGVGCEGW